MKRKSVFAAGLIAATIAGGVVLAQSSGSGPVGAMSQHGGAGTTGNMGGQTPGAPAGMTGGQDGMMGQMMQMMQMMNAMHGAATGGGMMGGGMDGMFQDAFDADGDGRVGAEELRSGLTARLAEFDADGDGTLTLAEFEALHGALIRNLTVDQFQAFDADGDGKITGAEIVAPADRLGRMEQMRGQAAPGQTPMMDEGAGGAATDGN